MKTMKDNETHPVKSFFMCGLISLASTLFISIARIVITAGVEPDKQLVAIVLVTLVASIVSFTFASFSNKHYNHRAFSSNRDFGRKFFVAIVVALAFSLISVWSIGSYLSGNFPLEAMFNGRKFIDEGVLMMVVVVAISLFLLIWGISLALFLGN